MAYNSMLSALKSRRGKDVDLRSVSGRDAIDEGASSDQGSGPLRSRHPDISGRDAIQEGETSEAGQGSRRPLNADARRAVLEGGHVNEGEDAIKHGESQSDLAPRKKMGDYEDLAAEEEPIDEMDSYAVSGMTDHEQEMLMKKEHMSLGERARKAAIVRQSSKPDYNESTDAVGDPVSAKHGKPSFPNRKSQRPKY